MMKPIHIMTTTLPDGSFNIFQWTTYKAQASIVELYFAIYKMETLELVYRLRAEQGIDEYENTLRAEFYLALQMDIITEITLRQIPMPFYSPN